MALTLTVSEIQQLLLLLTVCVGGGGLCVWVCVWGGGVFVCVCVWGGEGYCVILPCNPQLPTL